mmetsp:Transcript_13962/g.40480  ORF Transcript_13962/g.40480 Transcript_13962/m.40480 type:complete len:301 (+) Transcript_13962:576-1478(+)
MHAPQDHAGCAYGPLLSSMNTCTSCQTYTATHLRLELRQRTHKIAGTALPPNCPSFEAPFCQHARGSSCRQPDSSWGGHPGNALDLLHNLHNVFVHQHVVLANALRPVFCALAPHHGVLELLDKVLVDFIAEVLDGAAAAVQHDRLIEIRQPALGLGVHSHQVQVVPHHLHQAVQIPLVKRAHRAVVRQPVHHVELLQRNLVDLVDRVDRRDVHARALNHVDELVDVVVLVHEDVGIVDAILSTHGFGGLQVDLWLLDCGAEANPALVLALERDVWRLLVQPDAKALELMLDDALVRQRL